MKLHRPSHWRAGVKAERMMRHRRPGARGACGLRNVWVTAVGGPVTLWLANLVHLLSVRSGSLTVVMVFATKLGEYRFWLAS